jgi:ferredoxin
MSEEYLVEFVDSSFPPCKIPKGENLSEYLHACNSPILFGCRSGLCGVCLVEVVEGHLPEPNDEEREALQVYANGNPKARLACQIQVHGPLKIRYIRD